MSSASTTCVTGFIVHSFTRSIRGVSTICLVGRCDDHRTFAVLLTNVRPGFFVRKSDLPRAREVAHAAEIGPDAQVRTIDGEPCARLRFATDRDSQGSSAQLRRAGVRTYEADIDTTDALLMDHAIHGSLTITGVPQPGRHVDLVFLDPTLSSATWQPELSILSLDIETGSEGEVFAIGLCFEAPWRQAATREVLYTGMADFGSTGVAEGGYPFTACRLASERELLTAFFSRFSELDPDIITGWNVIDFDWQKLTQRSAVLGVRCMAGRSDEPALFLPADRRASGPASRGSTRTGEENAPNESGPFTTATMFIPGRQVIDGIRLLRYGPENFAAQSLDFVANAVLGMGKTVVAETGEEKVAEIERLRQEDPEALCRYCLQDAVLVNRILERTGLLKLTIARCLLIGVSLSRAWMSIRSFDFIYVEAMHRRGLVAPTLGVDALGMESAPGGAILTPVPGLFNWVMVFDFKSLYPSVIRTFNIDPVTLIRTTGNAAGNSHDVVVAPNGAGFAREPGILPEL
ncbi:MAG TPA: 3'-5' exonuclease, partial [Spirochaetia bacterium]|nr:3'-5' exonuclease [Spirochaetia bacterium]